MHIKPITMQHTSRQRLISSNGVVLERQNIYAPAETWAALQRLCAIQGRSGSLVIQSLIHLADLGNQKDTNDKSISRKA